eukprot:Skav222324  [mRNA]  locus=scaffold1249:274566:274721:- [translate_table: standard]
MSGAVGCKEMLEGHQQHVAQQLGHSQLKPFLDYLRGLKSADVLYIRHPVSP